MIFHDSRSPRCRSPLGAAACNTLVRLFVETDEKSAVLRLWIDNKEYRHEMLKTEGGFYYELRLPEKPCIVWYYFILGDRYYGNAADNLGGEGEVYAHEPPSYQITCYDPDFDTPEWLRDGIMMQIMPDRFFRVGKPSVRGRLHENWSDDPDLSIGENGDNLADDFFGGNLRGITEKLDYIEGLGVSVIYLNPIFLSPSNHKYNTSDYLKIDPSFGTLKDLKDLCSKAKKRGIRIILDGVFSHTGDDSVYFNKYSNFPGKGAYNSVKSKYRSWYKFKENGKYACWWDFDTLPEIDKNSASYREFIYGEDGVCAKYIKAGVSGWRLDVADELPMDFIAGFRARMKKEDPDSALIGEVWEDSSRKIAYNELRSYCLGDTLDSVMNYPLRTAIFDFLTGRISAVDCQRQMLSLIENTPECYHASLMNLLGSHDKPRAISVLADVGHMEPERRYRYPIKLSESDYNRGRARYIMAWQTVCALPGMPCIYYGDEAGMYGMADPYCRGTYPWGHEDKELIDTIAEINKNRLSNETLRRGETKISSMGDDLLLITRTLGENVMTLAVNRSDRKVTCYGHEIAPMSAEWI